MYIISQVFFTSSDLLTREIFPPASIQSLYIKIPRNTALHVTGEHSLIFRSVDRTCHVSVM